MRRLNTCQRAYLTSNSFVNFGLRRRFKYLLINTTYIVVYDVFGFIENIQIWQIILNYILLTRYNRGALENGHCPGRIKVLKSWS